MAAAVDGRHFLHWPRSISQSSSFIAVDRLISFSFSFFASLRCGCVCVGDRSLSHTHTQKEREIGDVWILTDAIVVQPIAR